MITIASFFVNLNKHSLCAIYYNKATNCEIRSFYSLNPHSGSNLYCCESTTFDLHTCELASYAKDRKECCYTNVKDIFFLLRLSVPIRISCSSITDIMLVLSSSIRRIIITRHTTLVIVAHFLVFILDNNSSGSIIIPIKHQ